MKFASLIALGLLCGVSSAYGDEAGRAAKADEFMQLAKLDENLQRTLALVSEQMKSGFFEQLSGVKLPPDRQKDVDEFQDKVTKVIADAFSWEKLRPAYVKLFADAYSEQELDDIIAFYKSPTGRSMVAKTPELMVRANEVSKQRLAEAMPKMRELMTEFVRRTTAR